ncbi:hypothetical protein [Ligaoa zhengdingensis]|uniref:hypothetical protein n=1 Tax=Ligaoa zhengdingensis TaxID=2763658 RepID=UPI0031BACBDB
MAKWLQMGKKRRLSVTLSKLIFNHHKNLFDVRKKGKIKKGKLQNGYNKIKIY